MNTEQIVADNQGLVVQTAKRFVGRGIDIEDLVQIGNIGLIESLKNYDATRGKLSTHAIPRIAHEMRRAIENERGIPTYVSAMLPRFLTARNALANSLGRAPSLAEVRPHVDISDADWDKLVSSQQFIAASAQSSVDEDGALYQFKDASAADPSDIASDSEERAALRKSVAALPARLRLVISMRFGLVDGVEKRLDDVAAALNVSRQRAQQLEVEAIEMLREMPLTDAA